MLGKILQQARHSKGLKQIEVAEQMGCTASNISSWERSNSKIDIDSFFKLCTIYGLDFSQTLQVLAEQDTSPEIDENKQLLLNNYDRLNPTAQRSLTLYSCFMVQQKENIKDEEDG